MLGGQSRPPLAIAFEYYRANFFHSNDVSLYLFGFQETQLTRTIIIMIWR